MIQKVDTQYPARFPDLARNGNIRFCRRRASRGVIMGDNNRGRGIFYRRPEYFPRMDDVGGQAPHGYDFVMDQAVAAIKIKPAQLFLGQIAHILQIIKGLLGGSDRNRSAVRFPEKSAPQGKAGDYLASFGYRDAEFFFENHGFGLVYDRFFSVFL